MKYEPYHFKKKKDTNYEVLDRRKQGGRKRRELFATDEEFLKVMVYLDKLREDAKNY